MPQIRVHMPNGGVANFPEGTPPAEIEAALGSVQPAVSHAPTAPPERTWTDTAVDALPMIGGVLGGIAGSETGPGAMVTAGVGGMAGEGARQIINDFRGKPNPSTTQGRIVSMGQQGALQGAFEGAGRLVAGGLSKAAGGLYRKALSPTLAARTENPNLIATGLEHSIPVSKGGLEKAGRLTGESMQSADTLVNQAAAKPGAPTIDPFDAVGGITKAVQGVRDLPVARPQMQAIGDYGRQYLAEHPQPLTLPKAQQAIRATDKFFDKSYRATMDRGNPITTGQTAAAMGINDETRNLLRQAVPGLKAQNAQTRNLAGLEHAIERRVGNVGNWQVSGMRHLINAGVSGGVGAVGGTDKGLAAFTALEALSNPNAASRIAIALGKGGQHPQITANLIRTALLGLMQSHEPSQP